MNTKGPWQANSTTTLASEEEDNPFAGIVCREPTAFEMFLLNQDDEPDFESEQNRVSSSTSMANVVVRTAPPSFDGAQLFQTQRPIPNRATHKQNPVPPASVLPGKAGSEFVFSATDSKPAPDDRRPVQNHAAPLKHNQQSAATFVFSPATQQQVVLDDSPTPVYSRPKG